MIYHSKGPISTLAPSVEMGTTFQIQFWREVEDTEQTGVQDELNAT